MKGLAESWQLKWRLGHSRKVLSDHERTSSYWKETPAVVGGEDDCHGECPQQSSRSTVGSHRKPEGVEHRCDRLYGEVVEIDCSVIHSLAEPTAGTVEYKDAAARKVRQQGDEGEAVSSISWHDDDGVAFARRGYAHGDSVSRKHDLADCVRNSVEVVQLLLGGFRSRDARIVVVEGEWEGIKHGVSVLCEPGPLG